MPNPFSQVYVSEKIHTALGLWRRIWPCRVSRVRRTPGCRISLRAGRPAAVAPEFSKMLPAKYSQRTVATHWPFESERLEVTNMDRKKARDFDQELLNLFDQYVHGGIDRRGFLDRAAKFAVGGVTAAMLLDALSPRFAEAQQVSKDDKRIK